MNRLVWGISGLAVLAVAAGAVASPLTTSSLTLYGTPGLIEMPTAESLPDGELVSTIARTGDDIRGTLTFQFHPRLTGSFRYAKLPGFNRNTNSDRFDRSFDIRFQFADETRWRPAMAIGLQDFVGTGVYSSEYIVATKTLSPKLRVTGGLGWGRFGTSGTITSIGDRPSGFAREGGQTNTAQWFRGNVAPFFGVSYEPTERLTLKAEYSSDGYDYEVGQGLIDRKTPWNLGMEYEVFQGIHLGANYAYGDRIGVQLSFAANPNRSNFGPQLSAAPVPVAVRPAATAAQLGWADVDGAVDEVRARVAADLDTQGIELYGMSLTATSVEVRIGRGGWPVRSQVYGRAARVLAWALPPSVEDMSIVLVSDGVPNVRASFKRSDLERLEHSDSLEMFKAITFSDGRNAAAGMVTPEDVYPRLTWSVRPDFITSFFDPQQPIRGDLVLRFRGSYRPAPGWVISGMVDHRLTGNLDQVIRSSNSKIERVRSDIARYVSEGKTAIVRAQVTHYGRPMENVYSRVTAGLLERQYGGVSGELLWKPVDSRLALGVEVNAVKQRAFDGGFGFRDYETVTGHASAYYNFGGGYVGQVHAGRYLAGDVGATFVLDRRFENGFSVGAFATFTDVSAEDFGEGSFDKGIRMSFPLTWLSGKPTTTRSSTVLRPLTRDGGQRVEVSGRLFGKVSRSDTETVADSWGMFWR